MEVTQPRALQNTLEMINAETQLLFTLDWPHFNFDLPQMIYDLPLTFEFVALSSFRTERKQIARPM